MEACTRIPSQPISPLVKAKVQNAKQRFSIITDMCIKIYRVFKQIISYITHALTRNRYLNAIKKLESTPLEKFTISPRILNFNISSIFNRYNIDSVTIDEFPELFKIDGEEILESELNVAFNSEILNPKGELTEYDGEIYQAPAPNYRRVTIPNHDFRGAKSEYKVSIGLRQLYRALTELKAQAERDEDKKATYKLIVREFVTNMTSPGCVFQKAMQIESCLLKVSYEVLDVPERERAFILISLLLTEYQTNTINLILVKNLPQTYEHIANWQRDILALLKKDPKNYPGTGFNVESPKLADPNFRYDTAAEFYKEFFKAEFAREYKPLEFLISAEAGPANGNPLVTMNQNNVKAYAEILRWFEGCFPDLNPAESASNPNTARALIPEANREDYRDDSEFYEVSKFSRGAMLFFYKRIGIIS